MKKFSGSVFARYILVGLIFPFIVQYTFYYRYTPNYLTDVFSKDQFNQVYRSSVFRYRILSRELHLWLYDKLASSDKFKGAGSGKIYANRLTALDPRADETFYFTYFVLAYIFTAFMAVLLLLIFDMDLMLHLDASQKIFITTFLVLLNGFSQFCVTPYDNPGLFFNLLSIYLYLHWIRSRSALILLLFMATIIISTTNRESSALSLSFVASIYISKFGLLSFRWIKPLIAPVLCFIITYALLRILLPGHAKITDELRFNDNINIFRLSRLTGIFFTIFTFYFILNLSPVPATKNLILNFLLAASPYILFILAIGLWIEFRLWLPLVYPAVILSKINIERIEAALSPVKSS